MCSNEAPVSPEASQGQLLIDEPGDGIVRLTTARTRAASSRMRHVITRTDTDGRLVAICACGDGITADRDGMSHIPADIQIAIWVQKHISDHKGATVQ